MNFASTCGEVVDVSRFSASKLDPTSCTVFQLAEEKSNFNHDE